MRLAAFSRSLRLLLLVAGLGVGLGRIGLLAGRDVGGRGGGRSCLFLDLRELRHEQLDDDQRHQVGQEPEAKGQQQPAVEAAGDGDDGDAEETRGVLVLLVNSVVEIEDANFNDFDSITKISPI